MIQNVPAPPQDFAPGTDAKEVIDGRLALGLNLMITRADKGNNEMKSRLAASAATLTCVVTTLFIANSPAHAATPPSPSAKVGIADIDLASPAGRKLLNSRVRMAAARLCLTTNVEPVKVRAARANCYRSAVANGRRGSDRTFAMRGDRAGSHTAGAI